MDVLSDAKAVVEAFREAADTAQLLKSRKERAEDTDPRELCMIELLHESLEEGATQCEDKLRILGSVHEPGNPAATVALKDVLITLQSIDLKLAKALGKTKLDAKNLYKLSVTIQNDAGRALDQVRFKGIPAQSHYGHDEDSESVRNFDDSRSIISQPVRVDSASPAETHPLSPPAPLFSAFDHNSAHQQPHPALEHINMGGYDKFHPNNSGLTIPVRRAVPPSRPVESTTPGNPPSITTNNEKPYVKLPSNRESDVMSQLSLHDSGFGSDTASSMYRASNIISEDGYDHERTSTISSASSPMWRLMHARERTLSNPSISIVPSRPRTPRPGESLRSDQSEAGGASTMSLRSAQIRPSTPSVASVLSASDAPEDLFQYAPEVVTAETAPRLYPVAQPAVPQVRLPSAASNFQSSNQIPNGTANGVVKQEPYNFWSPMPAPSRQNNWHGFCEGAWTMRRSMPEGITMTMISQSRGMSVSRWSCKSCLFQSTAVNVKVLPQQIYFNKRFATRYRWSFVARSHFLADKTFGDWEKYTYGCIFCLAEGDNTMMYKKLDPLLEHILAKHKPSTMGPEVKERTKCIVGRAAKADELWDINVPESDSKTALQAMRARVAAEKG